MRAFVAASVALATTILADFAIACGVSTPGVPGICDASEERATLATASVTSRAGIGFSYTGTRILFSGDARADATRYAALATYERRLSAKWSVGFGAGSILTGTLDVSGTTVRMDPGFVASATLVNRNVLQRGYASPFVVQTFTLAGATNGTSTGQYTAFDFRYNLLIGTTIADTLTAWAGARVFGGPIFWTLPDGTSVTGTDAYKVGLPIGAALLIANGSLALFVEGSPYGEVGLSTGITGGF